MDANETLYHVMVLMSGRFPTNPVDATFVFGRASGDWEEDLCNNGVLHIAVALYRAGLAEYVVIPGYDCTQTAEGLPVPTGYPGRERWKGFLQERLEVPHHCIWSTRGHGTNTKTEGDDFILLARKRGWKSAAVIMQPHQALRAMLGLVRSLEQLQYPMRIVPVIPQRVQWKKHVFGSQGQGGFERYKHIAWEWERIPKYQANGDLASLQELYSYLLAHVG